MVFESMVSDLLNRFIGDYVENLDKSQLKIGIWGGNVVLENLKVKENALSELDVPFKVKAGQIGKLTLKIPWKNLYSDAVVATLDGLYLLVVPGATIKYDAAKEERYQQEAKQKELQRIEEALLMAARREKPQKDEKKDTFAEKLATQVIKNLQVKITSIHIRYEDDILDPQQPVSMGVTLAELSLQTTDENWKGCILNEAARIIYKLGRLECLCAYWNVNSPIFYKGSWEEILEKLKDGISTKDQEIKDYQYIFKPIFASAKMVMNPSAEIELTSPKTTLYLEVQNVAVEMTKPQYLTMVDLLQSIDCMVKNGPYRKFRPEVPVHTNAKHWWKYSMNSILDVHIRRFNKMWSWSNIRKHRCTLKAYRAAYKAKLLTTQGKVREDQEKLIQDLEKSLDVFNITLARQQAQMEVIRSGQKVVTKKAVAGQKQGGGFFSSFFGRKDGKKKEQEQETQEEESTGIEELMSADEKAKLYTAIGYSGSSHNLALPKQYVAVVVTFKLFRTSITVREEPNIPEILKIQMIDLSTTVSQRPGAQAIKVEAALEHWYVTGLEQQGAVPSLIASVGDSTSSLLSILFEVNPEDSVAEQLLRVHSQPVEVIYDSLTVNSMAEFFQTGKGVDLEVLTSATLSKLEEIKDKTATGLSHIIETRKVLDLKIDLKPSYLLVPKSGFYHAKSDLMIIDFGSLQLVSVDQGNPQSPSFSSLDEIMDRAYEKYSLELRSVQVLYSKSGEEWKTARQRGSSIQHILQPMDFNLQLAKCMVEKDTRMARFKVSGELPLLHVKISDQKIQGVLDLVNSIPLPQSDSTPSTPTQKMLYLSEARPNVLGLQTPVLLDAIETDSDGESYYMSVDEEHQPSVTEELTDLHFKFEVKAVLLELTRQADQENTLLALSVSQLGAEGKMRTYDLTITAYLRKVGLDYCEIRDSNNQPLHLISSSDKHGSDLLKVEYTKADINGPNFQTTFDNTEQNLKVELSSLDFLLHTKALLSTINYLNTAVPQELTASKDREAKTQVEKAGQGKTVSKGAKYGNVFNFKLFAKLGSFRVEVCDDRRNIADIRIQGIDGSVWVQAKETAVFTRLRDIVVLDVDPKTIHKKAVSIVGEEVFSFQMSLYPSATEGEGYSDTSKVDGKVTMRLGCIQIVYLHKFLMSLLTFLDNFQTAKEALSVATAQAAQKAASSVRDFAQKSFRLSMDIRLKAPLIVIPQSSTSHNAFVVDLGLITVGNSFSLISAEGFPLPAVLDTMDVKLTQLKLSRTTLKQGSPQTDVEILQPINLELLVKRNLASSWYNKIPGVEVQGMLKSMNMALGQEDFGVLMKILGENIGEGSKEHIMDVNKQVAQDKAEQAEQHQLEVNEVGCLPVEAGGGQPAAVTNGGGLGENIVNMLLNLEIKEVVLKLKKSRSDQKESPFLVLHVAQLGIHTNVRKYDMVATTYIKKISMKCLEFSDSNDEPLCLISSSVESGADLLKVEYFKADRNGPNFATVHKNTEQMINVTFTSLDLLLHTEALLSTIDFLSSALSSGSLPPSPEEPKQKSEESSRAISAKSTALGSPSDGDVIDLKVMMQLGAFNVLVCDQNCNMADIKIQGFNGSLLMQGPQTHISARLRDFIVINVDPKSIHKKAISIVGDEVFSFSMSLTPKATEGAGYADTSKTDGIVQLNVGCVQVVYLHKFVMSLLNFSNNFQTAKEALSVATAQAAEKAASSIRDFAQKSFRLSMDIRLKAPLIIIPQSSTSHNALEVDLGLITVGNSFSLLAVEGCPLPAVIDHMDVQLTQLKLSSAVTESFSDQDGRNFGESFKVDVKVIQVTMESGLGHRTVPLLLAESSLSGTAKNWSSLLYLCSDMTLEVNYFNETHAVWEPLIERVEDGKRRWNLKLEMKNNPVQDKSPVPGDDFVVLPEPRTAINICSRDTMNITVSKCCLNVFTNLAKAFSEGTASTFDHSLMEKAPFTIRNALGTPLTVQHSANLRVVASSGQGKIHEVGVGQSVDLEFSGSGTSARGKLSALQRQESCLFNLSIFPTGYSEISNLAVDKPGRRLYNVRDPVLQENVSVLLQIDASEGNKVITVRSPLQIQNHFSVPFTILKYCPKSRGMVHIGLAEPEKESDVALDSYRCQLFLQPAGRLEGLYGPSSTCITWKEQVHLSSEVRSLLQCPSADSSFLPLQVTTLATPDHLSFISSQREDDWDPAYVIHLHPAVTLRNLLPYSIRYLLEGSADFHELQEGSTADILNARVGGEIMEMVLVKYQGRNWSGRIRIAQDMQEFFPVCFACDSAEKLTVDLSVHVTRQRGRLALAVFSPYWVVNKTSRVLQYRAEDVSVKHASDFRDVVLFSFRKKNIFSKNKLQLCVSTSSWSDGFSLDTVGSYGCVRCPANTMDYLVGVSIQMSSFNLTKMVTMSPFFTLVNKSSYELEVGEVRTEEGSVNGKWHYISSTECLPLWPELITGKLCVRVVGSDSKSKSFFFNKQDNGTLLGMDQYGGVIVDVNISDNSTVISFTDYYDGAAPALIVNHTPWVTITYRQSGSTESRELNPGEAQRFAWDDPAGVRKLSWKCQEHSSGELGLVKDECGQFAYDALSQVHWVSFLDGRQRVLLFTEDVAVVTKARQAEELEQFQQEVNVSLQNLGLSLINNDNRQEIAYVGITSSGVVWEMRPKNRWKSFNQRNIGLLEKAYQKHLAGGTPEPGWVKLETNLEVNFGKVPMVMRQPFSSNIRRNFLSGIHVEFKQSPHQRSLRAQLHWLQVDNQLTGAIFPIVFHPVPPPKSIALDSEPKPFMDVSIITRFNQHSQVTQFKYFMVLVQEMAVKIDQGFLGAILALFTPAAGSHVDKQKTKLIEKDLEMLQAELMEASMTDNSGLSFFEYFHISPIKLHLSLSLGSSGDESGQQEMMTIQSVNLLLKSLGATLTDVDDLIFKLAYYEVNYQFYRTEKLMWAVIRHYSEQFLKQMYVLVLGLDVLGNPFGLIRGLSEGVEAFFYEPFQGAVQGPEEFAEGFVIGVRSLLGHTVGGAAGMVSRITGSVGKGLAAITMDKEYQQKRREEMNRPPKDFGESLAKGGMGFFKGVVGGVTGIVTKPVEGAKKEGAAGFFKGIGKGLVGVVARPTGGIVDMASSTFHGIQRVAESTEEVTKLRPVRLIREDGIIRPYDQEDAKGYDLFQRSEIKQLEGEIFRQHCLYPGHRKTNVIVTNRRVMCVKEVDFVGHFNKEWECLFEHFSRPPYVEGGDLMIYCKEQNKFTFQKRDGQEPMRVLHLKYPATAQKLCEAIEQAQSAQRQHRMVKQKSQRFLKPGDKC
ncbi:intermembrane lipid transfer protein VPS13C [Salvelinus alpinus]